MNRFVATLVLPAFLLACGGGTNPFDPDPVAVDPGTPVDPGDEDNPLTAEGIPTSLANDLTRLNFNAATGTLSVEGLTLDDTPFIATYARRPGLDRAGYLAFTAQDDPLDRHNTAYAQQTAEGNVRGGVVSSGGPRNRFFAGGFYERDGGFDAPDVTPTTGMVSYSGNYVGLLNVDGSGEDLAAQPAGTPPELVVTQAAEVTGRIFINADFVDNSIEGNIFNRRPVDATAAGPAGILLPSIVLISTPINADGTFLGNVEYDANVVPGDVVGNDIGDYGGIFGGTNSSGVAGVVSLEEWDGPNDPLGLDTEREYGVFVLDQCGIGLPAEDPGCAGTNP